MLLYRVKESQPWTVGHVVSQSNGYIYVSSRDSKDSTKLVPGSSNILPVSAFTEGLNVFIDKGMRSCHSDVNDSYNFHL